jgi:hypothetical protein
MTERVIPTGPGWLNEIVPQTELSFRIIPKEIRQERFVQPQLTRHLLIVEHIKAGRFASAAHVRREHRANNPWIKE